MRAVTIGLAALFFCGRLLAQPANITDARWADGSDRIGDLRQGWLAFEIPATNGVRSPCCWQGGWKDDGPAGCDLSQAHVNYGSRWDTPLADSLQVLAQVSDHQVSRMLVVGRECPVSAGEAEIHWLGAVDDKAALHWLLETAETAPKNQVRQSALHAIAMHRSEEATRQLARRAADANSDLQREAIFWLGESRGEPGLQSLKQLLSDLEPGAARRELNFAIAQSGTDEAGDILVDISRSDPDPEQRSGAMFWLAEEFPERAAGVLIHVLETEQNRQVKNQAVFAISQLPGETARELLLGLARDPQTDPATRKQALFWLAQSSDAETIDALTQLLTR